MTPPLSVPRQALARTNTGAASRAIVRQVRMKVEFGDSVRREKKPATEKLDNALARKSPGTA